MADKSAKGQLLTINNKRKHLLVEFPLSELTRMDGRCPQKVAAGRDYPIIAHPERCRPLMNNISFLSSLSQTGTLIQVNAASVTGDCSPEEEEAAVWMSRQGWVHLIGSDAHTLYQRPPLLSAALTKISTQIGDHAARRIGLLNPQKILQGSNLHDRTLTPRQLKILP